MPHEITTRPETGRLRVRTINEEPSMTVQSDRHKSEMKEILRKYEAVGIVDHLRNVDMQFLDVSEFTDYADMARQLKVAEQQFQDLPSKVREIFNHSVHEWLDAAHDPEKLEAIRPKLEEMGLIAKRPVAASQSPDSSPADQTSPEAESGP